MANEKTVKDEDPQQGGSFIRNKDGSLVPNAQDSAKAEESTNSEAKKD